MTNRFMISVAAAALIAGTGFANAQGTAATAGGAGAAARSSRPSAAQLTGRPTCGMAPVPIRARPSAAAR